MDEEEKGSVFLQPQICPLDQSPDRDLEEEGEEEEIEIINKTENSILQDYNLINNNNSRFEQVSEMTDINPISDDEISSENAKSKLKDIQLSLNK